MKRKLLRQIANEWRTNIWLAVELLLVSCVMWWLTDQLWSKYATYNEPLGYDTSHCYLINIATLNEKSPGYVPYADAEAETADRIKLTRLLEGRPEVEAVATGLNAYFYNLNNNYQSIYHDSVGGYFLKRWATPDFFRVFRIYGANGETPEQLASAFETANWNHFFATDDLFRYFGEKGAESMTDLIGQPFYQLADSTEFKLIGTLTPLKYSDYRSTYYNGSVIFPLTADQQPYANETVLRVKDNLDRDFAENLMRDAIDKLCVGNWYISSVRPFSDIRDKYNQKEKQSTLTTVIWCLFLLLNIFLGVLGTFWFRTSLRTPEIALRMATGANRKDVFRRVIAEGEIILILVAPFTIGICYLLAHNELNAAYWGRYFASGRFFGCLLISLALIAIMILVGSCLPARKATSISMAQALKEE